MLFFVDEIADVVVVVLDWFGYFFPLDSIVLIPRLSKLSLLTAKPEAVNFFFTFYSLSGGTGYEL